MRDVMWCDVMCEDRLDTEQYNIKLKADQTGLLDASVRHSA